MVQTKPFQKVENTQIALFQVVQSLKIHSLEKRFDFSKNVHLTFG